MSRMTVALLDADIIAYQASSTTQLHCDWGDGLGEEASLDLDAAITTAVQLVEEWRKKARCRDVAICLSTKTKINFRKLIYPAYKANRSDKKRPLNLKPLIEALGERFKIHRIEGLEGDDMLGIMGTSDKFKGSVIVSVDKDMMTVPAFLLNPRKDIRPKRIPPILADYHWMLQTLMGDPTDNYPGCPGIGPKKAEAILEPCAMDLPAMWEAVVKAFEAKNLTEDDAITQARLARILRRCDLHQQTNEITLWHPRKPSLLSLSSLPDLSAYTPPLTEAESPKSRTSSAAASASPRSSSRGRSKR